MRAERDGAEEKDIEEPSRRKGEIKASVGEEVRRTERGETGRVFDLGRGGVEGRGRGIVKGRRRKVGWGCGMDG